MELVAGKIKNMTCANGKVDILIKADNNYYPFECPRNAVVYALKSRSVMDARKRIMAKKERECVIKIVGITDIAELYIKIGEESYCINGVILW